MRIPSFIRLWAADSVFATLAPGSKLRLEPVELVKHVAPVPELRLWSHVWGLRSHWHELPASRDGIS